MVRKQTHGHAAFRMMPRSSRPALAPFERQLSTPGAKAQSAANDMQDLLQKLLLHFRTDTVAVAREDDDILRTMFVNRIAANLVTWGAERNFRHRAIAIFYASLLLRQRVASETTTATWHMVLSGLLYIPSEARLKPCINNAASLSLPVPVHLRRGHVLRDAGARGRRHILARRRPRRDHLGGIFYLLYGSWASSFTCTWNRRPSCGWCARSS